MKLVDENRRRSGVIAIIITSCIELFFYLAVHVGKWPHFDSWYAGLDQQRYLTAAQAWSVGNLNPGAHYYLPGYGLMAAPFVNIFSAQPFVVVDIACILLMLGLFIAICRRLAPDLPNAVPVACLAFLIATLSSRASLAVWVVPWTTTPAAPLTLWALLSGLRFAESPACLRAFTAAFAAASVAWFRPADSAVALVCIGAFLAWITLSRHRTVKAIARYSLSASLGLILAVTPLIAVHHQIFGWAEGAYLARSAGQGFEWRLLPLRWITIALDPTPLFAAQPGLVSAFPWIIPGIAGLSLCTLVRRRETHALVGGAIVLTWLLYLSFRDLQVPNLWRFYNYHYFKWTQPFLAFYALIWMRGIWIRSKRTTAASVGIAVVAILMPWRASLDIQSTSAAQITHRPDGLTALALPGGLADIKDIALLTTGPGWRDQPGDKVRLEIGTRTFDTEAALAVSPTPSGIMLMPLRPLPSGPATVVFDRRLNLRPDETLTLGRQKIRIKLPCLVCD